MRPQEKSGSTKGYRQPRARCDRGIRAHAPGLAGCIRVLPRGPTAFDCSGLVHYVYRRFDINLPYTTVSWPDQGIKWRGTWAWRAICVYLTLRKANNSRIMMNPREFVHAARRKGWRSERRVPVLASRLFPVPAGPVVLDFSCQPLVTSAFSGTHSRPWSGNGAHTDVRGGLS